MILYLRYFTFLYIISGVVCTANQNKVSSSIGQAVDESFIYKNKKKKSITDSNENTALAVLKSIRSKTERRALQPKTLKSVENRELFVIAEVNNDVITNVDVLNAIKFIFFSSGKAFNLNAAKLMVEPVINVMIDEILQQQYAKLLDIIASDDEVNERVTEIASDNGLSVSELEKRFQEAGISMNIFKRNIRKKIVVAQVAQVFASNDTKISTNDIAEAKAKNISEIRSKRYLVSDILFRVNDRKDKESVRKNAEAVINLIKDGFSFQVMAETLSQYEYVGCKRNTKWVTQVAMEQPVCEAIKKLSPGQISGIIETKMGYKIICLLGVAEPGKVGVMRGTYKILQSSIQYGGPLFTEKDAKEFEVKTEKIKNVRSAEEYKKLCKESNIQFEETEIVNPNGYELNLISQSKSSGAPVIIPSSEKENTLNIIMLVCEKFEDAKIPDDKTIKEMLSAEKFEKEFSINFKRLKSSARIVVHAEDLKKVSR